MPTHTAVNIFWFRRDFRLTDNTGLFYALKDELPVLPIFIFDPQILSKLEEKTDARVSFIHGTLLGLKKQLEDHGSSLYILYASPEAAFSRLTTEYDIKAVYTNRDYEPYANERDTAVRTLLTEKGIGFYSFKDQVIFEKEEILNDTGGVYKVFTPYKKKWLAKWRNLQLEEFSITPSSSNFHKTKPYPVPSLQEIGFANSSIIIPPSTFDESVIAAYDKNRDFPAIEGTSRLGIHLRHGTISVRAAVIKAAALNQTWLNELIWREFYQMVLYNFPHVVHNAFKPQYDLIPWRNDEEQFQKWCEGMTGYPIVDAGMRELNTTGYMHNRVRMVVASFLTKHLLIDWRWGEAWFARKLLDFELASNNGGWQWAAGTGTDAQPYFRVFNPESQTDKFDKDKEYIRRWVPEYDSKNYIKPIVEHKFARQRAIDTYKAALK
ncbi:MAG: deoxyribodipyrimidine photo-lyase [Imperialibacter sp.]|uniref:cryptochrome/photolyase family protein n=1 Tax=Imperialibacter sp. TaxID=2038411 RepID=UPI0032EB3CBE